MVTMLAYGFLSFAGHRLRGHKDHSGGIAFGDLNGVTKARPRRRDHGDRGPRPR